MPRRLTGRWGWFRPSKDGIATRRQPAVNGKITRFPCSRSPRPATGSWRQDCTSHAVLDSMPPDPIADAEAPARARLRRPVFGRRRGAHRRAVRRASADGGRGAGGTPDGGARQARGAGAQGRVGAADRARAASGGFPRRAVRHCGRRPHAGGEAPRARAALRGEAPLRPAQGDEHAPGGGGGDVRRARAAAGAGERARRAFHRARLRQRGDALAAGRGRERRGARRGAALRRLGVAHARGPRRAQRRRAVPRAAQARLHEARADRVDPRERRERMEARRRPRAAARGICADRSRHGSRGRARSLALLHLVPRAGQGLLRARPLREEGRRRACRPTIRSGRARSA